ncbi:MAG: TIGR00266 family protein [Candidatus Hodarchaeota archaeon]
MQTATGLEWRKYGEPFTLVEIDIPQGRSVKAETGAMIFHKGGIEVVTKKAGKGVLGTLKRSLGGESLFINEWIASAGQGILGLAAPYQGDVECIAVEPGRNWIISKGGYIASTPGLVTTSKFQGVGKALFSGEGGFLLYAIAEHQIEDLFICSFGSFRQFELNPGEKMIIDTGNLVAMEASATYAVRKSGKGLKSFALGGEGLVMDVTGPGKVILQSHAPTSFLSWLSSRLPARG